MKMKRLCNVGAIVIVTVLMLFVNRIAEAAITGLTAWWSGDISAADVSGNEHNGILENGAQAGVPGLFGGAFQLDGSNDFVSTSLTLSDQGTFSLWVNPVALETLHGILGTFAINSNNRLWLSATGASGGESVDQNRMVANFGHNSVNAIDVPTPLVVGEWMHLALTFDYAADTYALYADGDAIGSSTTLHSTPTEVLSLGSVLSAFGQNFYFHGLMDEIQLYDRVLDESEIAGLAVIPVPAALPLFGSALGLMGFIGWRKRRQIS